MMRELRDNFIVANLVAALCIGLVKELTWTVQGVIWLMYHVSILVH